VHTQTDGEVIAASILEPSRFEEIFDRHYDTVRRYAQRRVGLDAGEELAAQTFLVGFAQRERFDATHASAKPWLMGIATNQIRHHLRSERTREAALPKLANAQEGQEALSIEATAAMLEAPKVLRILQEVPSQDREAFLLLAWADLSYAEIASALGIPVGTVRSKIHRVRTILRERLGVPEAIDDERMSDE
jgi:RNA polymerase sigma-70 factor, ECF subfamily